MGALGHKVFIPLDSTPTTSTDFNDDNDNEPILVLKTTKAKATGRRTSDGFIVYKGSEVHARPTNSCPNTIQNLREQHAHRIDQNNILLENILFKSPSAAAGFATYSSVNGMTMWETHDGVNLSKLESE